jgi:hypothetical protein
MLPGAPWLALMKRLPPPPGAPRPAPLGPDPSTPPQAALGAPGCSACRPKEARRPGPTRPEPEGCRRAPPCAAPSSLLRPELSCSCWGGASLPCSPCPTALPRPVSTSVPCTTSLPRRCSAPFPCPPRGLLPTDSRPSCRGRASESLPVSPVSNPWPAARRGRRCISMSTAWLTCPFCMGPFADPSRGPEGQGVRPWEGVAGWEGVRESPGSLRAAHMHGHQGKRITGRGQRALCQQAGQAAPCLECWAWDAGWRRLGCHLW